MKTYTLHTEQFIRRPLVEVFPFFEQPENLARITPSWLDFRIMTPAPIKMREGMTIEYCIRVMGIPVQWESQISEYEPGVRFVDAQLKGPCAFWQHTHTFTGTKEGTLIADDVRYSLPFGLIGQLAHGIAVKKQLATIFHYRAQAIDQLFADQPGTSLTANSRAPFRV